MNTSANGSSYNIRVAMLDTQGSYASWSNDIAAANLEIQNDMEQKRKE